MHVDGVFAGDNILDGAAADLAGGLVGLGGVRHGDGIDGISICRVSVVAGVQTEAAKVRPAHKIGRASGVCGRRDRPCQARGERGISEKLVLIGTSNV